MGKPFFEVFPTLKLDKELKDFMEQASVSRVSATKKKDFLRILYCLNGFLCKFRNVHSIVPFH